MAFGIAQITKSTFEILQDPNGETKDFIFNKIRQKDLKDPNIAFPLAIRWLHRKKALAKSKTAFKEKALANYREQYEKLKAN